MFICKVATEYTLACGEGVPSPNNPQRVDDTMLTTSHVVPSVSMAVQKALYLYNEGNEYTDKTGGWIADSRTGQGIKQSTYLQATNTSYGSEVIWHQAQSNPLDLSEFSKLKIEWSGNWESSPTLNYLMLGVTKTYPNRWLALEKSVTISNGSSSKTIAEVDISGLTTGYYIALMTNNSAVANYYKVWLEP